MRDVAPDWMITPMIRYTGLPFNTQLLRGFRRLNAHILRLRKGKGLWIKKITCPTDWVKKSIQENRTLLKTSWEKGSGVKKQQVDETSPTYHLNYYKPFWKYLETHIRLGLSLCHFRNGRICRRYFLDKRFRKFDAITGKVRHQPHHIIPSV